MRKFVSLVCVTLFMTMAFSVALSANMVNPNRPGISPTNAWAFNNNISISTSFSTTLHHQYYRLNVTVPDHTFRLTFISPITARSVISILNTDENIRYELVATGGENTFYVELESGTFFIQVYNSSRSTETYRLLMRPVTIGHLRAPGGQRVEVIDGSLYINNRRIPFDYNVSWTTENRHYSVRVVPDPFGREPRVLGGVAEVGIFTGPRGTVNNAVRVHMYNYNIRVHHPPRAPFYSFDSSGNAVFVYNISLQRWEDEAEGALSLAFRPIGGNRTWTPIDVHGQTPSSPISVPNPPQGLSIDFENETLITSSTALMQFNANSTTWQNFNETLSISSAVPAVGSPDVSLQVRYRETNMFLASAPVTLTIPSRSVSAPLATNVRFCGFTESILLDDTMEYRQGTIGYWTQISPGQTSLPVTLGSANITYQVRKGATNDNFASATLNVTVPRRLAAPRASYRASSDDIISVSTAMEFSLDGGITWTRATGTTIPRSALKPYAVTVYVRIAATATAAVSTISRVYVPGGPANAPAGLEIDFAREVVTGVTPGMQRNTSGTSWSAINVNELNITQWIPVANAANATLRIRFATIA